MSTIALKIDVDTLHGTRVGVPRLLSLLESLDIPATFLFSLGPDHTGRAIRRIFRPGFFQKVRRTSVVSNYGIRTLLYGTLLPGPDIGKLCRGEMLAVADAGFEVGVHAYDHVKWQDGVSDASLEWTRRQLELAIEAFERIFKFPPRIHGAAGWQVNDHLPALEQQFGIEAASDTRGVGPFFPSGGGTLQLPTTLPTLDELIGVDGQNADSAIRDLIAETRQANSRLQLFTAHAELEGGRYLAQFERLLRTWSNAGFSFATVGDAARMTDRGSLPVNAITVGTIEGRSGTLALQGT